MCGFVGCSSSSPGHTVPPADAGLVLNLPDAAPPCPDSGTAVDWTNLPIGSCVASRHPDFSTEVEPIFLSCSGEVCHDLTGSGSSAMVGKLSNECCDGRPWIVPGHPERSYMLDKLRGENLCAGARMPLNRTALNSSQIQLIADWICEGATVPHE